MSYYLNVIKDNPLGFWPLDESTFTTANDISGCGNHGSYSGSFSSNIMPLVYGGSFATKIKNTSSISYSVNKNFYKNSGYGGFATSQYSDNDFSLEVWFKQNITTSGLTPIIADSTNLIGLFYQNGNIIFNLGSESLTHKLSFSEKAMHIVAKYNVHTMEIYIDGRLITSKSVSNFKFTNSSISFVSGPTTNAADSFLIDAPAIYRYGLSAMQVYKHYYAGLDHTQPVHIVAPDDGLLLGLHGQNIAPIFVYEYTKDSQWQLFLDENTYYDEKKKYIGFNQTNTVESKEFIINDVFHIPSGIPIVSSKVEWRGDKNISVETSLDGITYESCTNGSSLPQFNKESYTGENIVYLRIAMSSQDTSKDLPRLSLFKISFYSKKELYAHNYGYYAESNKEYDFANFSYPVLIRHPNVGIKTKGTGGFKVAVDQEVRSVEFMFTPSSVSDNTIFYCGPSGSYPEVKLGWTNSGSVKSNISKVYVNGVDKTGSTNLKNEFVVGEPHHVFIVFVGPVLNDLQFNYTSSSNFGPACNYQNIALYKYEVLEPMILNHYNLYCGKPAVSVSDSSMQLTESSVSTYNQDYLIVSSA
jgi:hypothetical protein